MRLALRLAERGRGRTNPNPLVGAVIVSPSGVVVGSGYHRKAGEPHAEILALEEAASAARGATLYCTLEPCCHQGRTGPCVVPIAASGIQRVVIPLEDPDPRVAGRGVRYLG
ncbi:MAG: bifunctional diaminohydroxyphosphoribosylaminopyrimidine deaminase/5-amino-6-(5-phosphoribosylamino)uracil reductase RibD, partial [Vicinamibacteraceae bacterium]